MSTTRFGKFQGSFLSVAMLFAGFMGGVLLLFSGYTMYCNYVARSWPLTAGRIVSSRLILQDASHGPGNAKVTRAEIRYSYFVDGRPYESSNVSFAGPIGGTRRTFAAEDAVQYPEGAEVEVAYNPAEPADAVLDRSHDPYFTFAVGGLLIAIFAGYQFWLRGSDKDSARSNSHELALPGHSSASP